MLTKSTFGSGVKKSEYLDVGVLEEGKEYEKIAVVKGRRAGVSVFDEGYYTFYLRDCNASVVEARLFGLNSFADSGALAMSLEGKAVKIKFTATIFNGRWSLRLESIEPYTELIDYELFNARVEASKAEEVFNYLSGIDQSGLLTRVFTMKFLSGLENKSFSGIANGACGSATKVIQLMVSALYPYKDFVDVEEELFAVMKYSLHYYFKFLANRDTFSVRAKSMSIEILDALRSKLKDNVLYECVADTLLALLGIDQSNHLYSHLINRAYRNAVRCVNMISVYHGLPICTQTEYGGEVLLKY